MTLLAAKDGQVFSTYLPDCAMKQSVRLMTEVDALIKRANLSLSECDFFSAVTGPGSFTGIRIGISAIKGFCLAFDKPALGVTSFEIIAYNALEDGKILALIDAGHDAYYACGYEKGEIILAPCYLTEDEVLEKVEKGYALYSTAELPIYQKSAGKVLSSVDGFEKALKAKADYVSGNDLSALYVRKSSAELNLKK